MLLRAAHLSAATYYVAVSGSDVNDGRSPQQAWGTVTYAATKATAGDTVYIKAGLYRGEKVVINSSGTQKEPIIFQGYKDKPGDTPDPKYQPGGPLNPDVLPVLDGEQAATASSWNEGSGIVLQGKSHIEIRNLGVTSYLYGLYPQDSQYVVIENVFVVNTGSMGMFVLKCAHFTIRNCVVTDAADNNIYPRQTHSSVLENCRTYGVSFDKAGATDYYIGLQADCHDNVVRDCLCQNMHAEHTDIHPGHGIGIKDRADDAGYPEPHSYNNKFINCVARDNGEYLFVAHGAYNNEFVNCTAIGQWRTQAQWSYGIAIRDGAHDNTFRGCRAEGVRTSLAFQDTVEGPKNPDGSPLVQICSQNALVNCVLADSDVGMEISSADSNLVRNCVFDSVGESALVRFPFARKDKGNSCRNTIVTNVRGAYHQADNGADGEISFTYSSFWANAFGMPAGAGNMAKDPLFVDAAKKAFHLKSRQGHWDEANSKWVKDEETSPCIDAGDPADDFSAEPEPNGGRINMGAYGGTREASQSPEGERAQGDKEEKWMNQSPKFVPP